MLGPLYLYILRKQWIPSQETECVDISKSVIQPGFRAVGPMQMKMNDICKPENKRQMYGRPDYYIFVSYFPVFQLPCPSTLKLSSMTHFKRAPSKD